MLNKEIYTTIFLTQLGKSTNSANIKHYKYKWWISLRTKNSGGLRLSDEGLRCLISDLELKSYEIQFADPIDLSPQTIIFLDQYMDCPYHLTSNRIIVFAEKKQFELYMFSDDIRRYGLVKAMNNRLKKDDLDKENP